MGIENRQDTRYPDFGRVECDEISIVSGILRDISLNGCKVHFDVPVSFDPDNEYDIRVRLSRENLEPLELVCHPQWMNTMNGATDIGFEIMHSKDSKRLENYIKLLSKDSDSSTEIIEDTSCQFV